MTTNSVESQNISVYAEATPNPEVIKFVVNKDLAGETVLEFESADETEGSPLAKKLFEQEFVHSVFIMNNFVSVSKKQEYEWVELIPVVRDLIKEHIQSGEEVVTEELIKKASDKPAANEVQGNEEEDVQKIKKILNDQVKPAVEMDGGAIDFKSYENGVVTVELRGACSGCPSSMVTLKAGIEGLLKRLVPNVKEVQAEEA